MTIGTWLCRTLAAYGAEVVFGIPGVHTVELYRGLGSSGLRHITPRHEQGAGFMADGYARVSGRPGVCFIITGPGLTNIATAMGQAYGDSIPMLVVSTVSPAGAMGSGAGHLHELPDQRQLMAQVSAFSHTVLRPEELPVVLARAFAVFASARPRPVHIEIPVDLLSADASVLGAPASIAAPAAPRVVQSAVDEAIAQLSCGARTLIIAGGGAQRAAAGITLLAERLGAPVMMTTNGKGILPDGHPLGAPVYLGAPAAQQAVASAELILAIGTEIGPTDFGKILSGRKPQGVRLIRCDLDPQQLVRGWAPDVPALGDARDFVERVVSGLGDRVTRRTDGEEWAGAVRGEVRSAMAPGARAALLAVEILRDSGPDVVIAGDSTQPVYAACAALAARRPGEFFCSATGYGTLGYGLPAAIGAALAASATRRIFALIGDGGLQFTLPEMGAAIDAGVSVTMILWNNSGYGEIKDYMNGAGIEPLGVDIHTPDFAMLSKGYGWEHVRADSPDALRQAVAGSAGAAEPGGRRSVIEIDEAAFVAAFVAKDEGDRGPVGDGR